MTEPITSGPVDGKRPIVLAITSDMHVNSTVAMVPPEGVLLDDGGQYIPSKAQLWLWENWADYWGRVRRHVAALNAEWWAVFSGDLTEGFHHHSTQVVSGNPETQAYLADRVFGVPLQDRPAHTFIVRGTEAHTGPSGATEEALARHLKAERTPAGKWSWWHLRLQPHGVLVDIQHHPSSKGNLPWTRPQAIQRLAYRIWSEHAIRKLDPPDIAIRSHTHVTGDSGDAYPTRAIITPSWQLKTAHAHKVAADSIADVGGLIITVQPSGEYDVRTVLYQPELPPVWSAA